MTEMLQGRRKLGGVTPGVFAQRYWGLLGLRVGEDKEKETECEISENG